MASVGPSPAVGPVCHLQQAGWRGRVWGFWGHCSVDCREWAGVTVGPEETSCVGGSGLEDLRPLYYQHVFKLMVKNKRTARKRREDVPYILGTHGWIREQTHGSAICDSDQTVTGVVHGNVVSLHGQCSGTAGRPADVEVLGDGGKAKLEMVTADRSTRFLEQQRPLSKIGGPSGKIFEAASPSGAGNEDVSRLCIRTGRPPRQCGWRP
jgi:hypothetical protein